MAASTISIPTPIMAAPITRRRPMAITRHLAARICLLPATRPRLHRPRMVSNHPVTAVAIRNRHPRQHPATSQERRSTPTSSRRRPTGRSISTRRSSSNRCPRQRIHPHHRGRNHSWYGSRRRSVEDAINTPNGRRRCTTLMVPSWN